jgi:hypothetical protein
VEEPRNETARLKGGPHIRQGREIRFVAVLIFPKTSRLVKPEIIIFGSGEALPHVFLARERALSPKEDACLSLVNSGPHQPQPGHSPVSMTW